MSRKRLGEYYNDHQRENAFTSHQILPSNSLKEIYEYD